MEIKNYITSKNVVDAINEIENYINWFRTELVDFGGTEIMSPRLIIGWKEAKEKIKDFNILRHYYKNQDVYWIPSEDDNYWMHIKGMARYAKLLDDIKNNIEIENERLN